MNSSPIYFNCFGGRFEIGEFWDSQLGFAVRTNY